MYDIITQPGCFEGTILPQYRDTIDISHRMLTAEKTIVLEQVDHGITNRILFASGEEAQVLHTSSCGKSLVFGTMLY